MLPLDRPVVRRRRVRPGLTAAICLLSAAPAAIAQDLPLERITLYRSGVGAFERRGTVNGDSDIQLRVDADLVNDILKSMVLLDLDGGRIESASYGSREPLERRLASFAVDLSDAPGRAELLRRLRGSAVRLELADATIEGRVLSVEPVSVPIGGEDGGTAALDHVTVATAGGIESVRLDRVRNFRVTDPAIRAEIDRALAAIAEQRTDREKTLDLAFRGAGERRIAVSYVHEMPVWKTSYRLVLPGADDGGGSPFMQGWAIVENTTDEDWRDVRLGLVAGRPVGFVMDLYEPLFLTRPELPVPVEMSAVPRTYDGAVAGLDAAAANALREESRAAVTRKAGRSLPAEGGGGRGGGSGSLFGGASGDVIDMEYGMGQGMAGTAGEGTVFRYELEAPVTIERRRSAMLPILATAMEGRRVSILRMDESHPMRGVELTNSSGLQLMPGPISVYDGTAFAGDAQIDFVPDGDTRFLSYAVDLEVRSAMEEDYLADVRRVRIVDGTVEQTIGREVRYAWAMRNADRTEARTVVVEVPYDEGWEVAEPAVFERTPSVWRFEQDVAAGADATMTVVIRRTDRTSIAVQRQGLETVLAWSRDGVASDAVVEAVRRAGELQTDVARAQQRVQDLEQERNSIVSDQDRLRKNLAGVGGDSRLGQRYIAKLEEQETRIEAIGSELELAKADVTRREAALRDFVRSLELVD